MFHTLRYCIYLLVFAFIFSFTLQATISLAIQYAIAVIFRRFLDIFTLLIFHCYDIHCAITPPLFISLLRHYAAFSPMFSPITL